MWKEVKIMENSEKYLLFTVGCDKKTHELCVWVGGGSEIEEEDGITLAVVPKPSDLPEMAGNAIKSAVKGMLLYSKLTPDEKNSEILKLLDELDKLLTKE